MVAKNGNGGTHVAKRPATPPLLEPPARKIRTLVRAAEAYFGHARSLYWSTPRWAAVVAARACVGIAAYRLLGEPVLLGADAPTELLPGVDAPAPKTRKTARFVGLRALWDAVKPYARSADSLRVVSEACRGFFALRSAADPTTTRKRTEPLDVWFARSATLALPAEWHDDELYAERLAAIANAPDKRALAHAWAMVVDDAWPEETHGKLYAARQQRALYFSSRLPQRLEKAKTARTLRSVWAAVKMAGRAEELDAAFRVSVQRLGLSESQAARIAA